MTFPLAALVAALALGADAPKAYSIKLAAPGLSLVDVDQARGTFFLEYFCDQLSHHGSIRITTESEIAALVGFERERELLGCTDATRQACFVELADALGVDGLIVGNIAKVGSGFAATIKVVSSRDGDSYGSRSGRVRTEDELLDWLQQSARELAPRVLQHGRVPPPGAPPPLPPLPSSSSAPRDAVRLSLPFLRVEYGRRLWPRVLLGVRAGAPFGLGIRAPPSWGVALSAVGRLELGPREGLGAELVASAGGGYWLNEPGAPQGTVLAASAGAAVAYGGARLGAEAMLVAPVGGSTVNLHVAVVPELSWVFDL